MPDRFCVILCFRNAYHRIRIRLREGVFAGQLSAEQRVSEKFGSGLVGRGLSQDFSRRPAAFVDALVNRVLLCASFFSLELFLF